MSAKSREISKRGWLPAIFLTFGLAAPAGAATFHVDQLADDDGPCEAGSCSLREAALAANALPGVDVLMLAPGVHELTIPGRNESLGFTGDLNFREPVEIRGSADGRTVVDGNGIDGVFQLVPFAPPTEKYILENLTIRGGDRSDFWGGAVWAEGGFLEIRRCVFEGNRALEGGALFLGNMETTIVQSSFAGNEADAGGAILRVTGVTPQSLLIESSTLSGNRAGFTGGAIFSEGGGVLTIRSSTIAGNSAPLGSALTLQSIGPSQLVLESSILEGTCDWPGSTYPPVSLGGNLQGPGDSCFLTHPSDHSSVADLGLGPLSPSENGAVHELLAGSPAIDAALACPERDQRGAPRPLDGDGDGVAACDAGAYELGTPTGLADVPSLGATGLVLLAASLAALSITLLRRS